MNCHHGWKARIFSGVPRLHLYSLGYLCSLAIGLNFLLWPVPAQAAARSTEPVPDRPRQAQDDRPNIVLVMTDDQGYGDLSCHGHPFLQTPNIDRLYRQSIRFRNFHVSPTCAPTRSALLTGRAPFKNGVTHTVLERERLTLQATTIAQVLKSAGYTTGVFGKWHLGDADPYQPSRRGFDETFIHGAGGIGQAYPGTQSDAPGTSYFDPIIKHNGRFVQTSGYCTDVFFQQALGWIKSQVQPIDSDDTVSPDSATGDLVTREPAMRQPFFAYIATNAPHSPYDVDAKYSDLFQGQCKSPADKFLGMIVNIDENMGRLLEKLDQWNLSDNTVVVFLTDNGSAAGAGVYNAGMKGAKGTVDEGGTRVPLFVRWPKRFSANVDIDHLSRHYDLFPTLAAIAGATVPENLNLDGRSLLPLLQDPETPWTDRMTCFHAGRWPKAGAPEGFGKGDPNPDAWKYKNYAVRSQRWRLVNQALFDMENDPAQSTDVSAQHPEIKEAMRSEFDRWWDEVRELMVNEDAPLDTGKPFREQFEKQKAESGIPKWVSPEL